jgi:hypothetical protein
MKERLKLKTDLRDNLKMDLRELNNGLVAQNTMIRSQLEIEKLKGEIRDLTNEKARLEMKFNQHSNWICQKCTFSNVHDCSKCNMCEADREGQRTIEIQKTHKMKALLSYISIHYQFNFC